MLSDACRIALQCETHRYAMYCEPGLTNHMKKDKYYDLVNVYRYQLDAKFKSLNIIINRRFISYTHDNR